MEIPVLVEPLPDGGFRARSADPLGLTAQGDTADAALRHLRDLIETRTASGAILTSIEVPAPKSDLISVRGCIETNPSSIVGRRKSKPIARKSRTIRRDHEPLHPRHG